MKEERLSGVKGLLLVVLLLILIVIAAAIYQQLKSNEEASLIKSELLVEKEPTKAIKAISIIFGGGVIMGRTVMVKMDSLGVNYPFLEIKKEFDKADLVFATLEAPLSGQGQQCLVLYDCMVFVGKDSYTEGLKYAGFDVMSLAANHIGDGGPDAIINTIDLLKNNGILSVGVGKNESEAYNPVIIYKNGYKIGFLAYNEIPPTSYVATGDNPGSAYASEDRIIRAVSDLRTKVDLLIVSFHWGVEYTDKPTEIQVKLARASIDSGADVIIGDHPHWIQAFEVYKNKPIFYGVGNLVFDQEWSIPTKQGILVNISFKELDPFKIKIIPFQIEDFSQPRLAESDKANEILNRLYSASDVNSLEWLKKKI